MATSLLSQTEFSHHFRRNGGVKWNSGQVVSLGPTARFGGSRLVGCQQLLTSLHTKCCEGKQSAMELGKAGLHLGEEISNVSVTGIYKSRKAESKNYFHRIL